MVITSQEEQNITGMGSGHASLVTGNPGDPVRLDVPEVARLRWMTFTRQRASPRLMNIFWLATASSCCS